MNMTEEANSENETFEEVKQKEIGEEGAAAEDEGNPLLARSNRASDDARSEANNLASDCVDEAAMDIEVEAISDGAALESTGASRVVRVPDPIHALYFRCVYSRGSD